MHTWNNLDSIQKLMYPTYQHNRFQCCALTSASNTWTKCNIHVLCGTMHCNMNIVGKPEQAACNRVLPRPVAYGDITLLLLVTLSCGVKNAEILWSFHQTPLYFHASGCTVMYCLRVHHWLHLQVDMTARWMNTHCQLGLLHCLVKR